MGKNEFTELNKIRDDLKTLLNKPILKHFTDHSLSHSERMVVILESILRDNMGKKMIIH